MNVYMRVIRPINQLDHAWITEMFRKEWEGDFVVARGKTYIVDMLDGFIAEEENKKVGLITYIKRDTEIEIISLNSFILHKGVGTTLINAVLDEAKKIKAKRVCLSTTNNNICALNFYKHRGFHIVHIYPGAMTEARKIKPTIPLVDDNGIPINDEIELEIEVHH